MTTPMVCTCGGGPTTEVYHARECPLYRVQRAGSALLAALEHIRHVVSPYVVGRDECDRLDAAIRQAREG